MSAPMYLLDGGAVTAVGLDRPQTCAGIRARLSPFDQLIRSAPFGESLTVARIPAAWQLRRTPLDWLVNLATRAIREVLERNALDPAATVLVMLPPETFRQAVFDEHEADPNPNPNPTLASAPIDPLSGRLLARVSAESAKAGGSDLAPSCARSPRPWAAPARWPRRWTSRNRNWASPACGRSCWSPPTPMSWNPSSTASRAPIACARPARRKG